MSDASHLNFPQIDPIIFEIGPLALRWYGLMYLIGFAAAYYLAAKRLPRTGWTKDQLSDLLFWCFMGVIVGGRIGYVLFYNFSEFVDSPLYLFKIWEGGMSFHGGCLGVIGAAFLYAKKQSWSFLEVGDFIAPLVPLGLGAGRVGNFINGELWGRVTDVPWAFVFPGAGPIARHPSQLYQFALEGLALFAIVWLYSAKPRPTGAVGGLFLAGYGAFRFIVEFYREPDAHLADLYGSVITQGQMLSIPMIAAGIGLMVYAYRSRETKAFMNASAAKKGQSQSTTTKASSNKTSKKKAKS